MRAAIEAVVQDGAALKFLFLRTYFADLLE
jgi:hypothetical protein